MLKSLDTAKATGPDGIPAKLLKETADVIAPSLCTLFNKSISSGSLPDEWKTANIVPIHKKGDNEHAENYRPISLLCIISKVLERCVLNNVKYRLLEAVNICQHGFISGRSCVTNLIDALNYVGSCLDRGGQIDMIYMDMSKAFDKVNHDVLIQKLRNNYGFGGNLLRWFRSYLTNRKQRVTVLGATSNPLSVTSGVPQGSILGPALFLSYVNDLPSTVKSSQVVMFADDTKLFKEIRTENDAKQLQNDISNLESWSTTSGLSPNGTKCKAQTVTRKLKPITTSYTMKDCQLTSTKNERDLGVWISTDLRWNKQVNQQRARANKELSYIRRNTRTIHNTTTRRTIYLALVRSHLGYATQVWTPQSVELLTKVERTQRRATKFILNLPFTCSVDHTSRLQALQLLPICYWHEYLDMVYFFKVIHGLTNSPFVLRKKTTRTTRASNNTNTVKYEVPQCRTTTFQRSFWIRTIRTWNTLTGTLDLSMENLGTSKSVMQRYHFAALEKAYECDDPRTFKTICPKCNSARTLTEPVNCCF